MSPLSTMRETNWSQMDTTNHTACSHNDEGADGDSVKGVETSESGASDSTKTENVSLKIVWRNVALFAYLHLLSLYAMYCMFTSAKWQTNLLGESVFVIISQNIFWKWCMEKCMIFEKSWILSKNWELATVRKSLQQTSITSLHLFWMSQMNSSIKVTLSWWDGVARFVI